MTKQAVRHMPHVTVEQVLNLRERAIELESLNETLVDTLEEAVTMLQWYAHYHPDEVTEADNNALQLFEQVLKDNEA